MESIEIMEFYNKWWNYITPISGISISIIGENDGKSCIPLNLHYFNIKWIFLVFSSAILGTSAIMDQTTCCYFVTTSQIGLLLFLKVLDGKGM